jgi:two-component system NtrC family sensor kinase
LHIEDIDVNRLLQDVLQVVSAQERFQEIAFDLSLEENLLSARGNSDQVQQVLTNILINAADAMPHGGSIAIRTAKDKDWVTIAIRDTGEGIAPEALDKIYEPFYTTKSPDKGTGLGLSISLKIIDELGGRIKVQSAKGKGAEFIVYLKKAMRGSLQDTRNMGDKKER